MCLKKEAEQGIQKKVLKRYKFTSNRKCQTALWSIDTFKIEALVIYTPETAGWEYF